jgi:hypothetical protein
MHELKLHSFDLLWIYCTMWYNKSTTNRTSGVWATGSTTSCTRNPQQFHNTSNKWSLSYRLIQRIDCKINDSDNNHIKAHIGSACIASSYVLTGLNAALSIDNVSNIDSQLFQAFGQSIFNHVIGHVVSRDCLQIQRKLSVAETDAGNWLKLGATWDEAKEPSEMLCVK